jgi:deoxyribodipyrimidine photo-lyase
MLPTELEEHHERELAKLPQEIAAMLDARTRVRRGGTPAADGKCVVFWMQRAERGKDNAALDLAVELANLLRLPVVAFFSGIDNFPHANLRHYRFLQQGLACAEADLRERGVGFVLRRPPNHEVAPFLAEVQAAIVIGDENPLRFMRAKRDKLARSIRIPYLTVDADVVVPSRLLEKAQYAAYVARPRLERLRDEWLVPCRNPRAQQQWQAPKGFEWKHLDRSVPPVDPASGGEWQGGTHAATRRLHWFMQNAFAGYAEKRGEPSVDASTRLSPYLHFGHIGPATIALAAKAAVAAGHASAEDMKGLFNELLVWRELAINFVTYNDQYDSWECVDDWARKSLLEHAEDKREHVYTLQQLRDAQTHDDLWNASQLQMVHTGWMHNRMRMYWAKKILEWSPNAAVAFDHAVILNDTYELDGRDPNGYAGIAWAMVGKFDRPWFDRPIFGKVRYMSRESTGRKFDSAKYIATYVGAQQPALKF